MSGHSPHCHDHQADDFTRAFVVGIVLNGLIVIAELTFGLLGNSMALIADGGHNLSDVLGLVVGWAGAVMAKRSPSARFRFRRTASRLFFSSNTRRPAAILNRPT